MLTRLETEAARFSSRIEPKKRIPSDLCQITNFANGGHCKLPPPLIRLQKAQPQPLVQRWLPFSIMTGIERLLIEKPAFRAPARRHTRQLVCCTNEVLRLWANLVKPGMNTLETGAARSRSFAIRGPITPVSPCRQSLCW